jgi:hypothetical protein
MSIVKFAEVMDILQGFPHLQKYTPILNTLYCEFVGHLPILQSSVTLLDALVDKLDQIFI